MPFRERYTGAAYNSVIVNDMDILVAAYGLEQKVDAVMTLHLSSSMPLLPLHASPLLHRDSACVGQVAAITSGNISFRWVEVVR